IQPVDPDLAASLSLDKPKGALVAEVTPGSPAQKAGILAGDVIVKANAADMTDGRDVSRTVADLRPGTNAAIELWRNGKAKDVNVAIAVFPDKIETASADTNTPAPAAATQSLGLALTLGDNGVVVQSVDPSSEAAEKGIQPGDIIVKISGKDVKTPSDVVDGVSAAKKADKSSVLLLLRTQDQQRFVALTVKKA
ncbi:PDZ domain-containing protein, partial [Aerococcus loyolae]